MCRLFISKWKRAVKENKQACFKETLSLYHRSQASQGKAGKLLIGLTQQWAAGEDPRVRVGELWNSASLKKRAISPNDCNISAVCKHQSFWELVTRWSVGLPAQLGGWLGGQGSESWADRNIAPVKEKKDGFISSQFSCWWETAKETLIFAPLGLDHHLSTQHERAALLGGGVKDGGRQPWFCSV